VKLFTGLDAVGALSPHCDYLLLWSCAAVPLAGLRQRSISEHVIVEAEVEITATHFAIGVQVEARSQRGLRLLVVKLSSAGVLRGRPSAVCIVAPLRHLAGYDSYQPGKGPWNRFTRLLGYSWQFHGCAHDNK